ncbi:MAG: site-specific DNA-methyltransferase [Anaerolineae bacterium]
MRADNHILHGDALTLLPDLPPVDMVFADPPYNLQLKNELWRPNLTRVDAVDDDWDQFNGFADYDPFTREWLAAVRAIMADSATIWVSGTYHNIFRIGRIMQDMGFWLLNTITWYKPNAMPNFRGTRLKNDVEFVIWAKRSEDSTYTFNYHKMKRYNSGKQLGSVWAIAVCGGPERLRDAEGDKLHPTQTPEALLERIIVASTHPGDRVLDPFSGTGTTAAVANRLRRRWIGIEQDADYVAASRERIAAVTPLPAADPLVKVRQTPRRVPFRSLIAHGYLQPGQILTLDRPTVEAVVQADGTLRANGFTGSIHQTGAHLKGTPSCNGWRHWRFVDADGTSRLLDVLRDRYRRDIPAD